MTKDSKQATITGAILCLVILLYTLSAFFTKSPALPLGQENPIIHTGSAPVRLVIPRIEVDASIEQVGVTPQGAMDVPKTPEAVAWFNLGPYPAEEGSAVITGHKGWKENKPAVFDRLNELRQGDTILIEDARGEMITFIVRETRLYDANADTTEVFSSESGVHLNLITCVGDWNKSEASYSERLVVFTDIAE